MESPAHQRRFIGDYLAREVRDEKVIHCVVTLALSQSPLIRHNGFTRLGSASMTLVLSVITPHFAAQVSDRLVTRGARPFDYYANKNLVYFAADGVVSFGYSGPAYRGRHNASTDDWIMGVLTGEPEPGAPRSHGTRFRSGAAAAEPRTIDDTLALLQSALTRSAPLLPPNARSMGFELVGCGWRQRGDLEMPFICSIHDRSGSHDFQVWCSDPLEPSRLLLNVTPMGFNDTCNRFVLVERLGKAATEEELVGVLIEKVQVVGGHIPEVGQDCMAIVIPGRPLQEVRVRFSPLNTQVGGFQDERLVPGIPGFPVAFSPWIIAPTVENPPNVFLGDHSLQIGAWTVQMIAPFNPSSGVSFALASQVRKKAP